MKIKSLDSYTAAISAAATDIHCAYSNINDAIDRLGDDEVVNAIRREFGILRETARLLEQTASALDDDYVAFVTEDAIARSIIDAIR